MDTLSRSAGRSESMLPSLLSRALRRIARGVAQIRSRPRPVRAKSIAVDTAPRSVLFDIGLLDGRQVIPLRREDGWR